MRSFSRTSFTSELLNSLLSDDIIYAIDKKEYLPFRCPSNIRSSSIVFANGNLVESQIQIDTENMVIEKRNLLLSRYNKPLIETKPCLISSMKELKKFDSPAIKKMIKQGLIRCLYEWNFYGDILIYTKENGFYDSVIKILSEKKLKYILCKSVNEVPV